MFPNLVCAIGLFILKQYAGISFSLSICSWLFHPSEGSSAARRDLYEEACSTAGRKTCGG